MPSMRHKSPAARHTGPSCLAALEWQTLRRHASYRWRSCSRFDWRPRCRRRSFVGSVCAPHKHGCRTAVPSPHLRRGSPMPPMPGTETRPTPAVRQASLDPGSQHAALKCQTRRHQEACQRLAAHASLTGPTCVICIVACIYAGDLCGVDHVPDLLRCLHRITALLQLQARVVHLHHPWRQPLQSQHPADRDEDIVIFSPAFATCRPSSSRTLVQPYDTCKAGSHTFWYQGCRRICCTVIRLSGLSIRILASRSLHSGDTMALGGKV